MKRDSFYFQVHIPWMKPWTELNFNKYLRWHTYHYVTSFLHNKTRSSFKLVSLTGNCLFHLELVHFGSLKPTICNVIKKVLLHFVSTANTILNRTKIIILIFSCRCDTRPSRWATELRWTVVGSLWNIPFLP